MTADVVVVVPARNEARDIASCLRAVRASLAVATRAGVVGRTAVSVVAHRCTDQTARRARAALRGSSHDVAEDAGSETVGEVRRLGVDRGLRRLRAGGGGVPTSTWVLNTDADSVVPAGWVLDILRYGVAGHVAVVGMTTLRGRLRSRGARAAYRAILDAGMVGAEHDHVYGANLAVRADAYAAVGGFPAIPVGEDRALVEALTARGLQVARPRGLLVATSARRTGRAPGGLADLLADLDRRYASRLASVTRGYDVIMDAEPDELVAEVTICEDGPLLVRGPFTIVDQQGNRVDPGRAVVALCRCGRSASKPFCDGTHKVTGFRAVSGRQAG